MIAALWVLAPVLGAVHGLEHTHRYCPEHHAFEESSARESGAGPADPGHAGASHDGSVATGAAERGHQECAFARLLCRDGWHASERTGSVIGDLQHRDAPALESADVRSIPLLAWAPKSSPPAV